MKNTPIKSTRMYAVVDRNDRLMTLGEELMIYSRRIKAGHKLSSLSADRIKKEGPVIRDVYIIGNVRIL